MTGLSGWTLCGQTGDPDVLLEPYGDTPIDVLGVSCYTWNSKLQYALASRVKARYPNCLVIAGGPDPDYKDSEFFRRHPFIDIVAVKDGEVTFNKILSSGRCRPQGTVARRPRTGPSHPPRRRASGRPGRR